MKNVIITMLCAIVLFIFVVDSKGTADAVIVSLRACFYVIIPSLFGFCVLSTFLIKTSVYRILFKPLYLIFGRVLNFSELEFSVFCLSLVGGYPVGAKLVSSYISDEREGELKNTFAKFCYCPSPPFIINIIGIGLFKSVKAGALLYIACVLSCVTSAIFSRRYIKGNRNSNSKNNYNSNPKISLCLTESVNSAAETLIPVCAAVVFFGIVKEFFNFIFNLSEPFKLYIFSVLEISSIRNIPISPQKMFLIFLFSAVLASTGALCVIFQTLVISGEKISAPSFFISRIKGAILSVIYAGSLFKIFPFEPSTPTSLHDIQPITNPFGSICLMFMLLVFLFTKPKDEFESHSRLY